MFKLVRVKKTKRMIEKMNSFFGLKLQMVLALAPKTKHAGSQIELTDRSIEARAMSKQKDFGTVNKEPGSSSLDVKLGQCQGGVQLRAMIAMNF